MSRSVLNENLLKSQQIDPNQTTPIKTKNPQSEKDWVKRYNEVIDVYNSVHLQESTPINKGNQSLIKKERFAAQNSAAKSQSKSKIISLSVTKHPLSKLNYQKSIDIHLSHAINSPLLNALLIFSLGFLPVINLIILALLVSYMLAVKTEIEKHARNVEMCGGNPFQGFYYYPEMCDSVGKHFNVLNLSIEQIESFKFNETSQILRESFLNNSKQREKEEQPKNENVNQQQAASNSGFSGTVSVSIYDQFFYDSFFLVKKELYKVFSWVVLGTLLISTSVFFYSTLFDWV